MVLSFMSRPTRAMKLECFPSVGYLVQVTGQDRKTIIANLDKLERWGLLSDTGRRMGVTRQVIVYRLHMRAKISPRLPHSYAQAKKRRPKTAGKTPENPSQASRKRDTESFTKVYKKSLRAPAGAPIRVRSSAIASTPPGAGEGRSRAMADIADLIATCLPAGRAPPGSKRARAPIDPQAGGVS